MTMLVYKFLALSFCIIKLNSFGVKYKIKTCYLQLEWSALKTTTNKIGASILRMAMSFLKTPFCTGIGQVCSSVYQFITV